MLKKKLISRTSLFSLSFCFLLLSCHTNQTTYQKLSTGFKNPPNEARPKVYWWILNGNLDTATAKKELRDLKEAGITGFDFFEIGVPKGDSMIPGGPAFLSDESLEKIGWVADQAKALGLEMGLNLSSSWNAGGTWVTPKDAGKSMYSSEILVDGNAINKKIKIPFPKISFSRKDLIGGRDKSLISFKEDGKPEYYEDIALLAIPVNDVNLRADTSEIIDVTPFFDSKNDELSWNAPNGNWRIIRYVCANSGQQLVLPSPQSVGLTIDHFDSVAVEHHINYIIERLRTVLGNDFTKTPLKSFYLASYEARGLVWSSTLPAEFKRLNGYSITKFLPLFFDSTFFNGNLTQSVRHDFKNTLSEMMINNLYGKAGQICRSNGLKINSESGGPGFPLYNGPAEPLKALGTVDIPRGEFWVNHSRFYNDINFYGEPDSIDILRVVKEVSSASHIYQKGIVEEEAFTSFQHWQEGPLDLKPLGDRAFCEGMNRVVFHGSSHSPDEFGYPGVVYHAGTHFNNKRVWWPFVNPFVDYLSRLSFIFQNTTFTSDVLYYYGDRVPNSATPKNTHFFVGPGFDYEVINTDVLLNRLAVDENGKLVLPNGERFPILVLDKIEEINPHVLRKLQGFAEKGALIIGKKPKDVEVNKDFDSKVESLGIINELWTSKPTAEEITNRNEARIYDQITPMEALRALKISPDFNAVDDGKDLLDFIHYKNEDLDFYFVRNTTEHWITKILNFRQSNKIPENWDPLTGEITPVILYNRDGNYIQIPYTLPPFGSALIAFRNGQEKNHFNGISSESGEQPNLNYSIHGLELFGDGEYNLSIANKTSKHSPGNKKYILNTPWKISFPEKLGAPPSLTLDSLISWTNSTIEGVKYFSGIASYQNNFEKSALPGLSGNSRVYLNLGEVFKIAKVWINNKPVGIRWTAPFRMDVTDFIQDGENSIRVDVGNTWSNRIVGDVIEGSNYTNTNIPVSRTGIPWSKSPLLKSGLLGPVYFETIEPISQPE